MPTKWLKTKGGLIWRVHGAHTGVGTYSSGKGEFEIVRAKSVVFNCSFDDFIQEMGFAEDIFRHTKPKTKELLGINKSA